MPDPNDVAVFVDFENIYISVRNKHDANPNFELIRDRCEEFGRVTIARAYADWYRYPRVTNALYANSIEPMYVPTYYYDQDQGRSGKAIKNSVDIHLCIDMMKTLYTHPNIQTYVLVTGDRDFIPLLNAVRQHGKQTVVIGVAEASSSHLAQAADEFIFYTQLMDVEPVPEKKARDPFQALVEAVHLARKRTIPCTLSTLKVLMIELLSDFDQTKVKDSKGKPFSKFKDFAREAERRGLIQVFSNGSVSEVFLPGEDPYELSQFAPERPGVNGRDMTPEEESEPDDVKSVDSIRPNEWRIITDVMRQFDEPVLFIQIYDALRGLRNQEVLDLSNQQLRGVIKQAINTRMLQRITRGQHAYYKLNPEKSLATTPS